MDNSDLLRGLSLPSVQVFGVALTVLILALSAESQSIARPIALLAAVVMLVILAGWVSHAVTRAHPGQRGPEHQ